jgi:hypothetical protein
MDLVFGYESAALDAASKLDHGESTESDFRVALTQAMLRLKSEEAQRVEKRTQEFATQQESQIAQARAEIDAQRAASQREREIRDARRQAAIQQIIQNNQAEEQIQQQNAAAFMSSISHLMGPRANPSNCTTYFTGSIATTNCH